MHFLLDCWRPTGLLTIYRQIYHHTVSIGIARAQLYNIPRHMTIFAGPHPGCHDHHPEELAMSAGDGPQLPVGGQAQVLGG